MPHPSSPPPSPLGDCVAIRELQYSTHPAPTSSPACPDVAAVALSFGASVKKRNSQHHRDRAVAGIPSPMKKKVNFQPSPRRPVCTDAAAAAAPMDVDVSSDADDDMPSPPVGTRKTPLGTIADFVLPSITPSPDAAIAPRSITPSPGAAAPAPPPVSSMTSVVMRSSKNTKTKMKKGVQMEIYRRGRLFPTTNSTTTASIEYDDDAAEKPAGGCCSTTRTTFRYPTGRTTRHFSRRDFHAA